MNQVDYRAAMLQVFLSRQEESVHRFTNGGPPGGVRERGASRMTAGQRTQEFAKGLALSA